MFQNPSNRDLAEFFAGLNGSRGPIKYSVDTAPSGIHGSPDVVTITDITAQVTVHVERAFDFDSEWHVEGELPVTVWIEEGVQIMDHAPIEYDAWMHTFGVPESVFDTTGVMPSPELGWMTYGANVRLELPYITHMIRQYTEVKARIAATS